MTAAKMSSPTLTVIMSIYNGKRFLRAAVKSILEQTHSDFEFLIIDDGSTERVDEIVESFNDKRIVFLKQKNRGLTRTLNRLIDMASGNYLARMDSDDVSEKTRLEKQIEAVSHNKKLDMVGTYFEIIDQKDQLIRSKALIKDPLYRLWRLQFHNNYAHGSMLLKKSAVQRLGKYDTTLRYAQDYDLWVRISKVENSHMIPEYLYKYRLVQNSDQASVKNYEEQLEAAIKISDKSLLTSDPDLSKSELVQVRSVYWNFQLANVSKEGIRMIPKLFDGFCRRYGLSLSQRHCLWDMVEKDLIAREGCESFTNH